MSEGNRYLAIDLGASSGRTIVGTVTTDGIELKETHRFGNGMVESDGRRCWDLEALLSEVRRGIAASGPVTSMAIDTWGVDFGLLGLDGTLLAQPLAYRDDRHAEGMRLALAQASAATQYRACGIQILSINTIFQLAGELDLRPELLEQAQQLLFMPQLIGWRLTGEAAVEYTIASTSGLLNAETRDWAWELIDMLGLPRRMFGPIRMPGEIVGAVNGTPLCLVGAHDTASAVAAVPAEGNDWAYLSSGTWSLIGFELEQPLLHAAAAEANFTNEGGIGGRIRFLKNVTGLWLIQECRRIWLSQNADLSFADIADAAAVSSFAGCFDPNDERFTAPADMPAAIQTWFAQRGEAVPQGMGDIARACYRSLAQTYAACLDILRKLTGRQINRLHIIGGGSQAALLNQLTADACAIAVHAGPVEATAIGNIGVQAMANGQIADLEQLRALVRRSNTPVVYFPQ